MAIQTRATLKAYFETNDVMTAQSFADLIDSQVNLGGATAQTLNSDLTLPNLIATNVSAQNMGLTGRLDASAATFTGRLRQGVSAAASAADSRGDIIVVQETTVASNTTAQVAFLPNANIVGFTLKVLVASSALAGGLEFNIGIAGNRNYFGVHAVSGTGVVEMTNASAARLTGTSGAIEAVLSGASAGTNAIVATRYYQRA